MSSKAKIDFDSWKRVCESYCRYHHKVSVDEILGKDDVDCKFQKDLHASGKDPVESVGLLRREKAKILWGKLADVPFDEDDKSKSAFLHFGTGVDKFEIWHWFENEFGVSVVEDLMGIE